MNYFEGAESNAYNSDWSFFGEKTPDYELDHCDTLAKLRARSNKLIKDYPIAAGCQLAYVNLVGSPEKISITSKSNIKRKQLTQIVDDFIKHCSVDGMSDLTQVVNQLASAAYADGDVLINLPLDSSREGIKTSVELIAASRIDTPAELGRDPDVRLGVKYDKFGHTLGYYVKKLEKMETRSNTLADMDYFPAFRSENGVKRQVTYLFKAPLNNRPSMSRQYPLLTPCISRFKFLKDYEDAVLVGARVAACYSAFIISDNPAATKKSTESDVDNPRDSGKKVTKLQPGLITYLKRGSQDVKFASPNVPSDNVDDFRLREYKIISMAHRVPYEILFLDLKEANYSAWKGGILETKKMVKRWRDLITSVVEWVVGTAVAEAMVYGLVREAGDYKAIIRWPSYGLLDPEKESRANKTKLLNKTTSPQQICAEEGSDYDEVQAELEEHELSQIELQAKRLAKIKEVEKKYDIVYVPEGGEGQPEGDRQTKRREGEQEGKDLDEDDAKERRKDDGNW
jgi:lambda family phage portal protein